MRPSLVCFTKAGSRAPLLFCRLFYFFICLPFALPGRRRRPDVRKLLPEGLLDDARAAEVAKAYNAQEGVIAEVGGTEGLVGVMPRLVL